MEYSEVLDYLYARLPMFTRDGASAYKKDLDNTLALCALVGHPEKKLQVVHVAGTNGKGSSSHMLASILQEAGYKTGLYTSPHLVDFRERIRINGVPIDEASVISFVQNYQSDIERIAPSFFEVTVAMAFAYFEQEKVDIAVIETGLGGRLDSTNVVQPCVSLITNIGKDHMNLLGDTLNEIAGEKAGIIKPGIPVVISQKQSEVTEVFEKKAAALSAPLMWAEDHFQAQLIARDAEVNHVEVQHLPTQKRLTLALDLKGTYQTKNLLGVLAVVDCLQKQGWQINQQHIVSGLRQVVKRTGLQGRWQTLQTSPLVIADTGHNADGWQEVLHNIHATPHEQLHLVLGVMRDKDMTQFWPTFPKRAKYYFCQVDLPRALPAEDLAAQAQAHGFQGQAFGSVSAALLRALRQASSEDLIVVGGSTFVVGDLLAQQTLHP
jgi:dihydrofolate synthase/folylpolyglutamate synthase